MSDYIPMTETGYNKIRSEIERLENEEMPVVREKLAEARAEGDLKENAEYHGQRETLSMLTAKVNSL
ncbi:MAG: transcription elongation factor GreA, partial [Planctomycetota bacterium]|nr:transcription elongation factor GreA [Planctomycetota bacterium]